MSNKYYFEILSYLSPDQLDDLYKRNLDPDINLSILYHKKNKLNNLIKSLDEEIKIVEKKIISSLSIVHNTENYFETKDSLEASQYMINGLTVIFDEIRKVYIIKNRKN
jgi:antitoxin component YwqK of YwqJK toxin-antitoxin module